VTVDGASVESLFWQNIAFAYHAVAQLEPEQIFGKNSPLIAKNHLENGRTASTGWVGARYRPGGQIFMGINPGGGTNSIAPPPLDDIFLYNLLRTFKQSQESSGLLNAFERLNTGYLSIQEHHNIYRVLITEFLKVLQIDASETAFLNLVPFRTDKNTPPSKDSISRAWELASRGQLHALKPSRVFLLGRKVSEAINPFQSAFPQVAFVTAYRTNGDRYLEPRTKELLLTLKPF